MASDDPSSFSFIVRLVHLSIYTLVELSFGITQLLRTSAATTPCWCPKWHRGCGMTRSRRALFTRLASFMKVRLIAYMHRDEILDQRASARPFYMGMVACSSRSCV